MSLLDPHQVSTQRKILRENWANQARTLSQFTVDANTGSMTETWNTNGSFIVNMGTASGDTYRLVSNDTFRIPARLSVGIQFSQRITGNSVRFGLVAVNQDGTLDYGDHARAILGDAGNTTCQLDTAGGGATLSTPITSTAGTDMVASTAIVELDIGLEDVGLYSRALNSLAGRGVLASRLTRTPDPNRLYKLVIEFTNTAAPASGTSVTLFQTTLMDYQEVNVEIVGGRGDNIGGAGVAISNTPSVVPSSITSYQTESITPLGAAGTLPGTGRDLAASPSPAKTLSVYVFADQGGTLFIEIGPDGTQWNPIGSGAGGITVAAGVPQVFTFPVFQRWYRVRYTNGGVAQTNFRLFSSWSRA